MNFNIEKECASVANPLRYINQVVKQGIDFPVKLTEAYLYDSDTHSYNKISDLSTVKDSIP